MKKINRIGTLLRQDRNRLRILAEALSNLMRARRLVKGTDFVAYKGSLGTPVPGEVCTDPLPDNKVLRDIRWAITSINRTAGGRFTCLMVGIAVQRMLVNRGIPYAIVFGAKLGSTPDPRTSGDDMSAHAWVRAGGGIVVGEKERAMFAPLMSYVG